MSGEEEKKKKTPTQRTDQRERADNFFWGECQRKKGRRGFQNCSLNPKEQKRKDSAEP